MGNTGIPFVDDVIDTVADVGQSLVDNVLQPFYEASPVSLGRRLFSGLGDLLNIRGNDDAPAKPIPVPTEIKGQDPSQGQKGGNVNQGREGDKDNDNNSALEIAGDDNQSFVVTPNVDSELNIDTSSQSQSQVEDVTEITAAQDLSSRQTISSQGASLVVAPQLTIQGDVADVTSDSTKGSTEGVSNLTIVGVSAVVAVALVAYKVLQSKKQGKRRRMR